MNEILLIFSVCVWPISWTPQTRQQSEAIDKSVFLSVDGINRGDELRKDLVATELISISIGLPHTLFPNNRFIV